MCYNYGNLENVIIICRYDWWISSKSIHQSKPRLLVTNTHDYIYFLLRLIPDFTHAIWKLGDILTWIVDAVSHFQGEGGYGISI
jgi:hypothetical protein